jgi:hypothetical protein
MFIRETETKNKKTMNVYKSHKLVENYRTEKGVRQRVIMSLGSLSLPNLDDMDKLLLLYLLYDPLH